jgi:aminoglycoside 3-N-acetyltransferase
MIDFDDLVAGFSHLGVGDGDVVLVHSAYKSLDEVQGGPGEVIRVLLDILDERGTLIVPGFNFDFCEGAPWDVRTTPFHMGIISELVRMDPRSRRVFHPIYSFSVLG